MIWFTADTHFFHKNILKLSYRPFETLEEMHEHFIEQWNRRVHKRDVSYWLGDVTFGSHTLTAEILGRMNGRKILVKGNHDANASKMLKIGFEEVHENIFIDLPNGTKVFLSHFPYHPMDESTKNPDGTQQDRRYLHKRIVDDGSTWLLHGHIHERWLQNGRMINVGVDVHNYAPVSHEQIQRMIQAGVNEQEIQKEEAY